MKTLLLGIFAAASLHAPPFSHSISRVTAAQLPHSWHPGCPVSPARLRRVRLTYWGFDHRAHTGALVANENAVSDLVHVFSRLYAARFPIRRLQPIDAYGGKDERSLAADNTAAFNCRYVVGPGPRRWSVHAYGEAIDVNPIENPYTGCGVTRTKASIPYLNRSRLRRGMVTPAVVAAFRSIGWGWGGEWSGTKDYMHFSANGH